MLQSAGETLAGALTHRVLLGVSAQGAPDLTVVPDPGAASEQAPKRRTRPETAFISGTSSEFLGRRPLPRALQTREVVFLLGPPGVGKSAVGLRLAGDAAAFLSSRDALDGLAHRVRYRTWPEALVGSHNLVVDAPCFLARRPAVEQAFTNLLSARLESGKRTFVCQPEDGSSMHRMMDGLSTEGRATVVLRFPEGRGRRRTAAHVCDELGLDRWYARTVVDLEPWTYTRVYEVLRRIKAELGQG